MAAQHLGRVEDFLAAHVAVQDGVAQAIVARFDAKTDRHAASVPEQGHLLFSHQVGPHLAPKWHRGSISRDLGFVARHELVQPLVLQDERVVHKEHKAHIVLGGNFFELADHIAGTAAAEASPRIYLSEKEREEAAALLESSGIEEGARETRLDLTLRGVVASTADGLGHAIIEYRKQQEVYAVEDKLPVPGQVTLAKVMPNQVVLDNGGTYELLTLFEETELEAQLPAQPPAAPRAGSSNARGSAPAALIDKREDPGATALAQQYRDQLYQDPQSLAQVVRVSAVREDGALLGYRIGPGEEREQFEALGFQPGDLVTSINGIALNDPANTMRLYQTMRSASEAVFELTRKDQQLLVSVSLDGAGSGR